MALSLLFAVIAPAVLPDPLEAGWAGEPVCEVLQENQAMRMLRCSFPPGIGHEKHRHAPHMGYVLTDGKMQITDSSGTRTVEPKAGGSWAQQAETVHEVVNVGETTAHYLIIEPKGVPHE